MFVTVSNILSPVEFGVFHDHEGFQNCVVILHIFLYYYILYFSMMAVFQVEKRTFLRICVYGRTVILGIASSLQ